MSKQVARAYKEFLKQEKRSEAVMANKSAAGYMGIAAPRSVNKNLTVPDTPIQEVQRIVNAIRKNSGVKNA